MKRVSLRLYECNASTRAVILLGSFSFLEPINWVNTRLSARTFTERPVLIKTCITIQFLMCVTSETSCAEKEKIDEYVSQMRSRSLSRRSHS